MDFIYSKLDNTLISDNSDIVITRSVYEQLPNPDANHYMKVAVVKISVYELTYLCVKRNNEYIWKLITSSKRSLAPVIIELVEERIVRWNPVSSTIKGLSYDVYCNNEFLKTTIETSIDLSLILTEEGVYRIEVVAKAPDYNDSPKSNYVDYVNFTIAVDGGLIE